MKHATASQTPNATRPVNLIQATAQQLTSRDVLACQTDLIEALFENEAACGFTLDDMTHAWFQLPAFTDAEPPRIQAWWLVTPALAFRLKQVGESVLENRFGQWWGRTTSPTPTVADPAIQQAAKLALSRDTCFDLSQQKTPKTIDNNVRFVAD